MRRKPSLPPTTLAGCVRTVSAALGDIADASKKLEAREKRVQAVLAQLFRIAEKSGTSAQVLKLQMSMQNENQVFTSARMSSRHGTTPRRTP